MQHNFFRLRKILISIFDAVVVLTSIAIGYYFQQSELCKNCIPLKDPIHYLWLPMLAVMIFPYCYKITNLYNMTKSLISIFVSYCCWRFFRSHSISEYFILYG